MWPTSHDLLTFTSYPPNFDETAAGGLSQTAYDATYPFGWYCDGAPGGHNNLEEIYMYTRLGPKGSSWQIYYTAERGPDCGRVSFSIQGAIPEDATGLGYYLDGIGMPPGSVDRTVGTFYNLDDSGLGGLFYKDLYAGAQDKAGAMLATEFFRIYGDDGAVGTGFTLQDTQQHFDGGSGIYCIRARANGKNGSSSAYKIRFTGPIRIVRKTSDGYNMG